MTAAHIMALLWLALLLAFVVEVVVLALRR